VAKCLLLLGVCGVNDTVSAFALGIQQGPVGSLGHGVAIISRQVAGKACAEGGMKMTVRMGLRQGSKRMPYFFQHKQGLFWRDAGHGE
jgi:hypothetical protein